MPDLYDVLDHEINQALQLAHTALLGRITAISNGRADVRPLAGNVPTLQQVPWISHRYRYEDSYHYWDEDEEKWDYEEPAPLYTEEKTVEGPVYEVGDTVLVVFVEHPRDESADRGRRLDDGIIVGRVSL